MKKFNLKIQNKKLTFSSETHKALFNQFLADHEGKIAEVSIYQPIRSNQQNKFYWKYLAIIESETGNLASSLHEQFRRELLPPEWITKFDGTEMKIPHSTTTLTKTEFADYIDKISSIVEIPIPDSKKWLEDNGYISNKKKYY